MVDPDGSCSLHMVERVLESKGWAIEQIKKAMCQLAMPLKPDGRFYNYFGSVQESDKCRVARNLRALGDNLQVAATSKIEIRCDDPYCQCEPGLWAYRLTRKTYRSRSWEPNHIIYLCPAVSQRMLNHTDTLHEQDLSLLLMTELGQIRDVIRPPLTQQSGEGAAWSVVANYTHEWAVRSSWNLAYFAQCKSIRPQSLVRLLTEMELAIRTTRITGERARRSLFGGLWLHGLGVARIRKEKRSGMDAAARSREVCCVGSFPPRAALIGCIYLVERLREIMDQ